MSLIDDIKKNRMKAALIAAEELSKAASMCLPATDEPMSKDCALRLGFAIAAYRKATDPA